MKSIPTLFLRDKTTRLVINKMLKLTDWVSNNKGVATRKYDGVAIKVENGKVFRRYEWKEGEAIPQGFVKCESPNINHTHIIIPGWIPVPYNFLTSPTGKDEKALKQAWDSLMLVHIRKAQDEAHKIANINPYSRSYSIGAVAKMPDGTYELCGPDIRGNHEKLSQHELFPHGGHILHGVPRSFDKLREYLETFDGEGIIWHYQSNGITLMAKIKRRDFGFLTRTVAVKAPQESPVDNKEPVTI